MDKVRIILPEMSAGRLHILAAVSGGADSVAMLSILKEAAEEYGFALTAAHFEHGIRAEESIADAAFVRALCREWAIELIEEHADVPAIARARSVGLEQAARDARYEFLRRARNEVHADYIALAHHRDDQAETVLMHLLRGCGLRGASGMKEVEGDLYRPLLSASKETLVGYLESRGITWREDSTNVVADNPRNAIRLHVMPQIDRVYPGGKQAICRFSEIAAAEDGFMQRMAERFLKEHAYELPFGWLISFDQYEGTWEDMRVLLMRTVNALTGVSQESVMRAMGLLDHPERGRAVQLENGWDAERGRLGLYLIRRKQHVYAEIPLPQDGEKVFWAGKLSVKQGFRIPVKDRLFCQELGADALKGAVIRTRRDGDWIHPLGAPGRQKLSEYFINHKIDRPLRDVIPLIAQGDEIIWVMGVGISEKARLREETKAVRLELTDWLLQKFGGTSNA